MAFYGKYGHLSSVDAAIASLKDIAAEVSPEYLNRIDDHNLSSSEHYDLNRLYRVIEGCQMVIILNEGKMPDTGLPLLFDKKKYNKYSS